MKMKRPFWLPLVLVLIAPGTSAAERLSLGLNASHFAPSDQAFQDIYGGGLRYGVELEIAIKKIEIWVGASRFTADGETTFTREPISLEILPLEVGVRYRFTKKKLIPYVGVGIGLYFFSESNPIGDVDTTEFGFLGEVGTLIRLSDRFSLDLRIQRSYCTLDVDDFEVEIGGMVTLVGVRYHL
jgi:outer membrane protein W